jgi:hypothetical protein
MDHKLAESLQSVDKYLLNELPADQRTMFEEHLFDCPLCADQVRQSFTVLENLKQVLREEKESATSRASDAPSARWSNWFRIPSLVPTFAAVLLACLAGYQHFEITGSPTARILPPPAAVLLPVSRGESVAQATVPPAASLFRLEVKGDSTRLEAFTCQFQNAAGTILLTLTTPPQASTDFDLQIQLPAHTFPPGRYLLTLHPASEPDRIITYPFAVQDSH